MFKLIGQGESKKVYSLPFTKHYVLKIYKYKDEQYWNEKNLYSQLRLLDLVPKSFSINRFCIQQKTQYLPFAESDVINKGYDNIIEYIVGETDFQLSTTAFEQAFRFINANDILYTMDNLGIINNKVYIIDWGS